MYLLTWSQGGAWAIYGVAVAVITGYDAGCKVFVLLSDSWTEVTVSASKIVITANSSYGNGVGIVELIELTGFN